MMPADFEPTTISEPKEVVVMTSAEARNVDATVDEFIEQVYALIRNAREAGIPVAFMERVLDGVCVAEVLGIEATHPIEGEQEST